MDFKDWRSGKWVEKRLSEGLEEAALVLEMSC